MTSEIITQEENTIRGKCHLQCKTCYHLYCAAADMAEVVRLERGYLAFIPSHLFRRETKKIPAWPCGWFNFHAFLFGHHLSLFTTAILFKFFSHLFQSFTVTWSLCSLFSKHQLLLQWLRGTSVHKTAVYYILQTL